MIAGLASLIGSGIGFGLGEVADDPSQRNLKQEGIDTYDAYKELLPYITTYRGQYLPYFTSQNTGNTGTALYGLQSAYSAQLPFVSQLRNQANTTERQGTLSDYGTLTGQAQSVARQGNPYGYAMMDNAAAQYYNRANSDPFNTAEYWNTIRGTRANAAARGFGYGQRDAFDAALAATGAADTYQRQALSDSMAAGAQMSNLYSGDVSRLLGTTGQNWSALGNMFGQANQATASAENVFNFNPYADQYAQDAYNSNYNSDWIQYYNNQDRYQALGNLMGSASGSALSKYFKTDDTAAKSQLGSGAYYGNYNG